MRRLSLLYAYAMQKRDQDTSVSENQALVSRVQSLAVKAMAASSFAQPEILEIPDETMNGFLEMDELKAYKLQIERLLAKKPHSAFREGGSNLSVCFRDRAHSVIGILLI